MKKGNAFVAGDFIGRAGTRFWSQVRSPPDRRPGARSHEPGERLDPTFMDESHDHRQWEAYPKHDSYPERNHRDLVVEIGAKFPMKTGNVAGNGKTAAKV
jgi:hypothetical protein